MPSTSATSTASSHDPHGRRMVGAEAERADQLRARDGGARAAQANAQRRPRVFFEEWDEPLISGIGWVSELIGVAGGDEIFPELSTEGWCEGADRHAPRQVSSADPTSSSARGGKRFVPARSGSDRASPAFRQLAGAASRDQIDHHPAAGAGSAHRRTRRAAGDHRGGGAGERCRKALRWDDEDGEHCGPPGSVGGEPLLLGRLDVPEHQQQRQVIGRLESAAEEQRPGERSGGQQQPTEASARVPRRGCAARR